MVQTANLGERDDPTGFRALHWPWLRGVLVQSEMRSTLVIVGHEASEVVAKAGFTEDDHVVQAFTPDRADHTFDVGTLRGRARRRQDLRRAHRRDLIHESVTEEAVAVPDQIARCRLPRKRLSGLLGGPFRRWVSGHTDVKNAPSGRGLRLFCGWCCGKVLLVVAGVAIGGLAALGLSRVVATLLFGVSSRDAAAFARAISVMAVVALLATMLPARRAAKVDPTVALRYE